MILYTPLCETDVFPESDAEASSRQFISYQGKTCLVDEAGDGSYEVLQLLSTDPHDFLNEQFTPGNIIS